MLEYVKENSHTLAIIIRSNYKSENIKFFTENNSNFQVGYMNRNTDYEVKPHYHTKQTRIINTTSEVLLIKNGKINVDFFDSNKKILEKKILNTGDIIVFLEGGHGVQFLEKTEIIEIKQGPYMEENDKNYI
tara:strand:- start:137 stop:532 length:396 start_codon:yes stop_codon:yes gene_type:complete